MDDLGRNQKAFGAWGEQLAAAYLSNLGYQIVFRNYRCRYGEMDLVCRYETVWCFVEVKTRQSTRYGDGWQAITIGKQKRLRLIARYFLNEVADAVSGARFDIVAIDYRSETDYQIRLLQNAF
jgi:putative endonuclease